VAYNTPDCPSFTLWVCRAGLLREAFRLIDIGVQGGIHRRWNALEDHLELWAFDALKDVIDELSERNQQPDRRRYIHMGIGSEDGERLFERVSNPYGSAFLPMIATEDQIGRNSDGKIPDNWSRVQIRRLDTLYAEGTIGPVDALKMDCEGFEIEIVKGAQCYLSESGVFAVESETHFFPQPSAPRSHFVELYERLISYGFEVYDLGFYRTPRIELRNGFPVRVGEGLHFRSIGQPNTFDFLFLGRQFKRRDAQPEIPVDRLLKMIITCELYGLQDVAVSLLLQNRDSLGSRLDVDHGATLLCRETENSTLTYKDALA
jgi:FkbM family methyltransferase